MISKDLGDFWNRNSLQGEDILGIQSLTTVEVLLVLDLAAALKSSWSSPRGKRHQRQLLKYSCGVLVFEKESLRTRLSFEAAMFHLGGRMFYCQQKLEGGRDPVNDIAGCLSEYVQVIVARTCKHSTQRELAKLAKVPVINGLDDVEHPCQGLADGLTMIECLGGREALRGAKLAWIGDANNNVLHSVMQVAVHLGMDVSIACPNQYKPAPAILDHALGVAGKTGARIEITDDPRQALEGADFVEIDTHVSMGQELDREWRLNDLRPYRLTAALLAEAKPSAKVLHCLPARRGEEVDEEVLDGRQSVIYRQAGNRLAVQKALLKLVLQNL